jgi:hypothetical protein
MEYTIMNDKKLEEMSLEEKVEHYELLMREKDAIYQLMSKESDFSRARSFTVGSGIGGVVDINMRGPDGKSLHHFIQPVEVSELIHTLAATIGCYVALRPREDFTAWRNWTLKPEERELLFNDPAYVAQLVNTGKLGLEHNNNGKSINIHEIPAQGLPVKDEN